LQKGKVPGAGSPVEPLPVHSDLGSEDDSSLSMEKRAGLQQHRTYFTELLYASPSRQKKGRMDKIVFIENASLSMQSSQIPELYTLTSF
jgi:hypothetical protein